MNLKSSLLAVRLMFTFDVPTWADEEWYNTLAPGIDIITMSTAWTQPMYLKTAVFSGCDLRILIL